MEVGIEYRGSIFTPFVVLVEGSGDPGAEEEHARMLRTLQRLNFLEITTRRGNGLKRKYGENRPGRGLVTENNAIDLASSFAKHYNRNNVRMFYFNAPKRDKGSYLAPPNTPWGGGGGIRQLEVEEEFTMDNEEFRDFLQVVATDLKLVPCPGITDAGERRRSSQIEDLLTSFDRDVYKRVVILCERELHMHTIVDQAQLSITP